MIPIELASIHNIRDLGDTPASHGRRVRPGCLIRSAHLADAAPEDLALLKSRHRLRWVLDLRTEAERVQRPDRAPGLQLKEVTLIDRLAGITRESGGRPEALPDMAQLYRVMMTSPTGLRGFREALRWLFALDYRQGAALWHCTEGKDRCGMTTALALEALGVDREIILADYLETNRVNEPKARALYERLAPEYGEAFAESVYRSYIASPRYLEAAWDAMGEDYLGRGLGLTQQDLTHFRAAVLQD